MSLTGKIKQYQEQIKMVWKLSVPAILAEISSIVMQYIDTAMVGSLGANASASIGLVASSTWLIGGICISIAMGFSVQVSQMIGGKKEKEARAVLRQGLYISLCLSLLLAFLGFAISDALPQWLGGAAKIRRQAGNYFLIYSCALPFVQLRQLSGSMLQCSGDMRSPSILNSMMCGLDVVLNGLLIFPTRTVVLAGAAFRIPGAGLGVTGAALGTALSEAVTAGFMLYFLCFRSGKLRLSLDQTLGEKPKENLWKYNPTYLKNAAKIAIPMAFEHTIMCTAQVMSTKIVAPLGTIAVAANSLAVTAESVCYMPGYGIGTAATTLVGQQVGAGNKKQARSYARISVVLGTLVMTVAGIVMFLAAPFAFRFLTTDMQVQQLGVQVLRIEMFAEPFYAMSIVAAGALRGAGDTMVPSLMSLCSMWGVRIVLSFILAPVLGLKGVWIAMTVELCFRGMIFLIRLLREKWLRS